MKVQDDYRQRGLEVYGDRCEICGYSIVEVHHVDYNLHAEWENRVRRAKKRGENLQPLLAEARELGFLYWDGKDLSKDNRSTNLSVLCPNHHSMVHTADMSLSLLKIIPTRK